MFLLSFCVCTCNQPEKLRRLLDSLVGQVTDEVEVLIRDDSVSDASEAVVREFESKFPIRYIRGKKEGLDRAIVWITEAATGKYVWWMGDDALASNAITSVMGILHSHSEVEFLYTNSKEFERSEPALNLGESRFLKDRNEAITLLSDLLGYVSANCFLREYALSGKAGAEKYYGSAWSCLYLTLHILSQSKKIYYLADPLILGDPKVENQGTWYDILRVFTVNFYNVLSEFRGQFTRAALRKAISDNWKGVWRGMVTYRAKGFTKGLGSDSVKLPELFRCYWTYPQFYVALPLLLLPRFVLGALYRLYKWIFRPKHD